jgi:hypothetical protein
MFAFVTWYFIAVLYLLSIYFIGIPLAKKSLEVREIMNHRDDNGSTNKFRFRSFCFFPIREFLCGDFYQTENSIYCLASASASFYYNLSGEDLVLPISYIQNVEKVVYILAFAILWPVKLVLNMLIILVIASIGFVFVVFMVTNIIVATIAVMVRWLVMAVRRKIN